MKHLFILAIFLFGYQNIVWAQDTIVKKNNTIILSKILELNDSILKYKRFKMLDGPMYTIDKKDVQYYIFQDSKNKILLEYNQHIEKKRNDSIMQVKMEKYYMDLNMIQIENKPQYNPKRKGMHFGLSSEFGISGLHETGKKTISNNSYYYNKKESSAPLLSDGLNIRFYNNNTFSFRIGVFMRFLQYSELYTYYNAFSGAERKSYTYKIDELSVPLTFSLHYGRKVAFIGELGLTFNFPYKLEIIDDTNLLQTSSKVGMEDLCSSIINQIAHIGILWSFNHKLSMDMGINQMYSLTSYRRNSDYREFGVTMSVCLYYKLNS